VNSLFFFIVDLFFRFFLFLLDKTICLYGKYLSIRINRKNLEELVGDLDEQDEYAIMVDQVEAYSQYLGNIVPKHVGHENIGVLALTHIYRIGDVTNYI
jgi:hypothetical protein